MLRPLVALAVLGPLALCCAARPVSAEPVHRARLAVSVDSYIESRLTFHVTGDRVATVVLRYGGRTLELPRELVAPPGGG